MRTNVTLPIAAALAAAFGLSNPAAAHDAPEAIAVSGETLVATVQAIGAQIYECKADMSGGLVWQFREPVATLFADGNTVGRHYAGPHWEMADGSIVSAKVSGRAPGASESDIPLLRLEVASRRGAGQLAGVTTIQRINTKGGLAEGACEQTGALLSVPYTADYAFFRKAGVSGSVPAPVQSRPAIVHVPVAAPYPVREPAVSVIVLPRDIPHRPRKKKKTTGGQPKTPPVTEPTTPAPGSPSTPPTAEPSTPPSKAPSRVVRDHRGSSGASGGGRTVTTTRPVYDGTEKTSEKRKPEIRDHRGVDSGSREKASENRKPNVRDQRGSAAPNRGASGGGGSAGPGGCGVPGNPPCRTN